MDSNFSKYIGAYEDAGLKVTPLRDKRPILASWYDAVPTQADWSRGNGIGLVCGNGLEAIDVDLKYDVSGTLWARLQDGIGAELMAKLVIQRTRSGGFHLLYFCEEVEGNQKLASRPATDEELAHAPQTKQYVLVETRGEHGQVVIYPSEGYRFTQGNPRKIQQISIDERAHIMAVARSLDEMPAPTPRVITPNRPASAPTSEEAKPWEIYDAETTALQVLEMHGWTALRNGRDGKGRELVEVMRPGGETGKKSATYYPDSNIVYSHTTSSELPAEEPLRPSVILAHLAYGGDFKRMGRELRQRYAHRYATAPKQPRKETQAAPAAPAPEQPAAQASAIAPETKGFFAELGLEKADGAVVLVFYSYRMGTIVRLAPSALTTNNLITLAPLYWWESQFPTKGGRAKFDLPAAADWLYEVCAKRGFFDVLNVRGRGAWEDAGRIVINTGEGLVVDGVATAFRSFQTRYIYDAGLPMDVYMNDPMGVEESALVLDACKLAYWDREQNAGLLAGWLAIAPVCGVLQWRPHIWLTGPSGSGKSTLWKGLVPRILGDTPLRIVGETSGPAIRNALNSDGRPVLFDEFEATDKASLERQQSILAFARVCSSDDAGQIMKADSSGGVRRYQPRACFGMASIGVSLSEQSDRRRFTIIATKKVAISDEFKTRSGMLAELCMQFNKSYRQRLQARIISMLPTILQNIEVFADVVALKLGGAAYGDQLAPILAGWAALVSDAVLTPKEATDFVLKYDWGFEAELEDTRDEVACLDYILQSSIEVEGDKQRIRRTIGELLEVVFTGETSEVAPPIAKARLLRAGVKLVDLPDPETGEVKDYIVFANASKELKELLAGKKTWGMNHAQILKRLDGALATGTERFGPVRSRGVAVPFNINE